MLPGLLTRRERAGRALSGGVRTDPCRFGAGGFSLPSSVVPPRSARSGVLVSGGGPGPRVARSSAGPGPGSLARGTRVRQLQLPPDNATGDHGRLPPVTPGHLGRRGRLIPVSPLRLHSQLKTSNWFPEIMAGYYDDELELPDQPRPGAVAHRPRPGRAAARHRGQPGHHRAQHPRHRHRPDRSRLPDQAERRPPQPLPDPGPPPAARTRHPGTRHRRSPRPPRGRRRETAADRARTNLGVRALRGECSYRSEPRLCRPEY